LDLTRPEVIIPLMRKHGIAFRKSLGQNFLTDRTVLSDIVQAGKLDEQTCVLEVGPGAGVLTRELAQNAGQVVTVELDDGLIPLLNETLAEFSNVEIVHSDILKVNMAQLVAEKFDSAPFCVIANLPYYISTPVMMHLIGCTPAPQRMVFMLQKEVAERLAATPGSKAYGALSLATQLNYRAELLRIVPPESFTPAPKVHSAVIRLEKKAQPEVEPHRQKAFLRLVHGAFAMRRKTLCNNLISAYALSREAAEQWIEATGLPATVRAEQMDMQVFIHMMDVGIEQKIIEIK